MATLEALQQQHAKDMLYSANMNLAFDGEVGLYDNHILKDALLKLLQVFFPPVDDHCAISHYCWELNFGKIGSEVELTAEDLWDELVKLRENKYNDAFEAYHLSDRDILTAGFNHKMHTKEELDEYLGRNDNPKHGQE